MKIKKKIKKTFLLGIIKNIKERPEKIKTTINLFNTGIIVESGKVKQALIKIAEEYIKKTM